MTERPAEPRSFRPRAAGWLARFAMGLAAWAAIAGAAPAQTVPTYHGSADRSGLYVTPGLTWSKAADVQVDTGFSATVNGSVYAQPLYWLQPNGSSGHVIVATETNDVYSLDAPSGKLAWHRALATPVTLSALPCGNINPIGVTGTPVIDTVGNVLYLDALVADTSGPRRKIFALDLYTGKVLPGWPVDVETGVTRLGRPFLSTAQGQRSALTIVNGQVYVTYAGNAGDCSTYHGTVIQLALGVPKIAAVWQTRANGGGIWAQSGIAFDGESMFVATGNTMGANAWEDGEAVIRLHPGLKHSFVQQDMFTPNNWKDLDNGDTDLGGTGPLPIDVPATGGGTVPRLIQLGKDGNAYLLDRSDLGGTGRQIAAKHVSSSEIISAAVRYYTPTEAMVAFVSPGSDCPAGQSGSLVMLRINDSGDPLATAWCAAYNGAGAPIITTTDGTDFPIVWVMGVQGDSHLHAYRGFDGKPLFTSTNSVFGLQRNATILVAQGRFYVAGQGPTSTTSSIYAYVWR
jgi:outer membrane protein assembly factor BamB